MSMAPWPYPRWVAHRGAGKLAPENTLAAFRLGASHGYRMFECDAKLSADGVVFLMHDATLTREAAQFVVAAVEAYWRVQLALRDREELRAFGRGAERNDAVTRGHERDGQRL